MGQLDKLVQEVLREHLELLDVLVELEHLELLALLVQPDLLVPKEPRVQQAFLAEVAPRVAQVEQEPLEQLVLPELLVWLDQVERLVLKATLVRLVLPEPQDQQDNQDRRVPQECLAQPELQVHLGPREPQVVKVPQGLVVVLELRGLMVVRELRELLARPGRLDPRVHKVHRVRQVPVGLLVALVLPVEQVHRVPLVSLAVQVLRACQVPRVHQGQQGPRVHRVPQGRQVYLALQELLGLQVPVGRRGLLEQPEPQEELVPKVQLVSRVFLVALEIPVQLVQWDRLDLLEQLEVKVVLVLRGQQERQDSQAELDQVVLLGHREALEQLEHQEQLAKLELVEHLDYQVLRVALVPLDHRELQELQEAQVCLT